MLNDSHASCNNFYINNFIGTHVPAIEIHQIENKTIITHIFDDLDKNLKNLGKFFLLKK